MREAIGRKQDELCKWSVQQHHRIYLDIPDSMTSIEWILAAAFFGCSIFVADHYLSREERQQELEHFAPDYQICADVPEESSQYTVFRKEVGYFIYPCAALQPVEELQLHGKLEWVDPRIDGLDPDHTETYAGELLMLSPFSDPRARQILIHCILNGGTVFIPEDGDKQTYIQLLLKGMDGMYVHPTRWPTFADAWKKTRPFLRYSPYWFPRKTRQTEQLRVIEHPRDRQTAVYHSVKSTYERLGG
ncbi:hypothetical protein [Marinicrinis sediminis]|uniref:Uncharacterized protein n=1 Tax=Marinicrinis sediminis TaxID=1652465 RepID=A0ABW5RGB1_9BACL